MKINELKSHMDRWAPPGVAWDRDNPGLQVGDPSAEIRGILLAFDATTDAIQFAYENNKNLLISHHPLLFHPLKNLNTSAPGLHSVVTSAVRKNISILSYHTNLDFTEGGVSFSLAEKLGLSKVKFLESVKSKRNKMVVFVPADHAERVAEAAFSAGGGVIGAYSGCSFSTKGTGTFYGNEESNPVVGIKGNKEEVDELRLEIIFNEWDREAILNSVRAAHPYEQPAIDIYKLENSHENFGSGAIGELTTALTENEFLRLVSEKLNVPALRHNKFRDKEIKKVAVCGGAGEEHYKTAVSLGADAFVTADIRYHNFIDSAERIFLVDAGHFETEAHILERVKLKLERLIPERDFGITVYPGKSNPVFYYIFEE